MTIKEKKRLEVLWETHEITTIRFGQTQSATSFYCQSCQTETLHLTVREAVSVLKISESTIFRFVETNQIHSIEDAAGFILICGNSLLNKNNK